MSYKIIVARYNENLDWLRSEKQNCIIYNKGQKLGIDNEIMIPNIGRESETYLHYIITNYDKLPDVIVFTQGRIADHRGSDDVKHLLDMMHEAFYFSKSQNFIRHNDKKKEDGVYKPWNCWDSDWNFINGEYALGDAYKDNKPSKFIDWFKENINKNYPNPIKIYCNAIFAVKKELILNRPIEYYKKLILQVNHHMNAAEGHFFERSWYYIFN
jgi:hypothetical protein